MRIRLWLLPLALALPLAAQSPSLTSLYAGLRWREIGPMRAGRTHALSGVPSQPNVFYIGAVNGGVWKTTDAGETWQSIFDHEPTGSIGAVAVAASDPNVVYAASGEGLPRPDLSTGDGIYKSTDAGRTWTHLAGLRNGQQIAKLIVDPRDPNRLFVAVLGHPYAANDERGVFRSTDGGATFQRVLFVDENTGANDVDFDPSNSKVLYAALWAERQGPWENGAWVGTTGGMFKSTDGGDHWTRMAGGLPTGEVKVNSIAVAPSDPQRVYAPVQVRGAAGTGLYRSDDGGATWRNATRDPRIRGDEQIVAVDPRNENVVYDATRVAFKSTDGGVTWTGWRGAPGGDDYQNIWINPNHGSLIALASDQGAIVTVNGGATWSQWYNQATAQMYHVTIDNAYPWRACGGQQDSGSACVSNRGPDGQITFNDWHPVGIQEYGYAAPDPLDPDVVYGVGQSDVTKYDRRTGQIAEVTPMPIRSDPDFRTIRTMPLVFSPADPHTLYFGANRLYRTSDAGHSWSVISPDLSRATWAVPASVGVFTPQAQPTRRGVIYALAPSPLDANLIWAGTDDGLIWITHDGGAHWQNVTPPELKPWWKVSILDAGHFDPNTAYAAINTLRLDDMTPHLFRTHDGGRTWSEIDRGLPAGAASDAIREDPKQKGLLYAGTETQVWVSFNDGDSWHSLRQNMPAVSVRDLQVKDDDLVAGTHGRGFEVLDDVTPLRQIAAGTAAASAAAILFKPETATRVRWDMNPPTPWPPEMANGVNPPDGAIFNYYLKSDAAGPVTLEIADSSGKLVRRFSSDDPVPAPDRYPTWPLYWNRPPQTLATAAGGHRFIWNLHYAPAAGVVTDLDDSEAVAHLTPRVPTAPWVLPGDYTVKLTVAGQTYTQPLRIRMDPRVKTSPADLQAQLQVSMGLYQDENAITAGGVGPSAGGRGLGRGGPARLTLATIRAEMNSLLHQIQSADVAPTLAQVEAAQRLHAQMLGLQQPQR